MVHRKTIVLGGGLSGLAVAHYLGGDTLVLEAEDRPGGICRSIRKDGFVYDIGGHIMFSKNQEILREMVSWLGDNVVVRERKNVIWYKDRFVKYPFENGLAALDKEEIFEILMSFLNRPQMKPQNLEEWCYARFGKGLAEKYLIPYNRKIWKHDPKKMSLHWVERIPSPPVEDIVKSAIGIETEGYQFQVNFHYPREGGFESLIRALAERVPAIETGFRVSGVKRKGKGWAVSNGLSTLTCDRLVSTIPVFALMDALEDVPEEVRRAVRGLKYNSLILIMVGLDDGRLTERTSVYFPDPEVLAHRVCYPTYFSKANAPARFCHSASAMVSMRCWRAMMRRLSAASWQTLKMCAVFHRARLLHRM